MSFAAPFMPSQSVVQAPTAPTFFPSAQPFYQANPPPQAPPPPPFQATQSVPFRPATQWTPTPPARVPVMPTPAIPQQFQQPQMPVQQQWAPQPGMPSHFQVPAGLTPSTFGYYGYAPDQMWSALAAVPPMWRPQQPGETFTRRWAVNIGLNATETLLQQLLIGVRQIFLPPMPKPQPQGPVVDAQQ